MKSRKGRRVRGRKTLKTRWEGAVDHRELSSVSCDDLEGGLRGGREV